MAVCIPQHLERARRTWRRTALVSALMLGAIVALSGCASTSETHGESAARSALPFPGTQRPPAAATGLTATVVSYPVYRDPLIRINRATFAFNDVLYRYALIPVSQGYTWIMPDPVEQGIGNFFYNLKTPIYVVNHLLQAKMEPLGVNLARFGINTTVGLLGFFDPAAAWLELEREEAHLEDTLARYGVGYGIYLVLPLYGPSDLRNGPSSVADHFLSPVRYVTDNPATTAIESFDYLQDFAPGSDRYEILRRESDDPYIFFRNLYLQGVQRDAEF